MKKNLFILIVALVSLSAIAQNKETTSALKPVNITQLEHDGPVGGFRCARLGTDPSLIQ